MESVQQDAISRCDHLKHHDIGTCEIWARVESDWNYFHKMQQGVWLDFMAFVGVLIACANEIALEEGKCVHQ